MTRRIRLTEEEYQELRKLRNRESNKRNPRKVFNKKLEERKEERKKLLTPCLHCGHSDLRVINLHHINKIKFPELVIPLCFNCHMLLHRLIGQRGFNNSASEALEILKKDSKLKS